MKLIKVSLFILIIKIIIGGNYPDYDIKINNNPYSKNLFIHTLTNENSHMAIIDTNYNVIWNIFSNEFGFDFKVNNQNISYFCEICDFIIIANNQMNEIDTLISINNNITNFHDVLLLDNGGYMLLMKDSILVNLSELIDEPIYPQYQLNQIAVIEEYDIDDSLIFYWKASDYINLLTYLFEIPEVFLNNFQYPTISVMWGNSIEIDQDNNILLSNKLSSEIIKINRTTGDVIWILGGPFNEFNIINDPLGLFNNQHDVRSLENGNISLLDNGTEHNPMISRAVEYELDEINKTATLIWEYSHPDSLVAFNMGSVQRLPNQNTLINWGNVFIPGEEFGVSGSIITEVDYNKNIVMELVYSPGSYIYKARKEDWNFAINLIKGDTNLDSIVNVVDIIYLINYILTNPNNQEHTIFNLHKIDLNTDGVMDVIDITTMVNIIIE